MKASKSDTKSLPILIREGLDDLVRICEKHQVRYLYIIGSVLRPADFHLDSDIDFVFALEERKIEDVVYNSNLASFWQKLEELFERKVDLIHGPSLKNPYLIQEINRTKVRLYGREDQKVLVGHSA